MDSTENQIIHPNRQLTQHPTGCAQRFPPIFYPEDDAELSDAAPQAGGDIAVAIARHCANVNHNALANRTLCTFDRRRQEHVNDCSS